MRQLLAVVVFAVLIVYVAISIPVVADDVFSFISVSVSPSPNGACLSLNPSTGFVYFFDVTITYHANLCGPGDLVHVVLSLPPGSAPAESGRALDLTGSALNPGEHTATWSGWLGGGELSGYAEPVPLHLKAFYRAVGHAPIVSDETDVCCYAVCLDGCVYSINLSSHVFPNSGGDVAVSVTAVPSTCSWITSSPEGWVTVSPPDGTGNGTATVVVGTNTGAARSCTLNIAGKPFSVTQEPAFATPVPPSGVAATNGSYSDQIVVTWSASSGATSYKVYRASSSAGVYSLQATISTTSWTDSGLGADVHYWYKVTACNAQGCSAYSLADEGWASSAPAPDPPTGVSATDGAYADRIALSWNASSGATSYKVYRAGSSGGTYNLQTTQSATDWLDTGLSEGVHYWYKVTACNAQGCSAYSQPDEGYTSSSTADLAVTNLQLHRYDAEHATSLADADKLVVSARIYNNSSTTKATGVYIEFRNDANTWSEVIGPQEVAPAAAGYFQVVRSFEGSTSEEIEARIYELDQTDPLPANDSLKRTFEYDFAGGSEGRTGFSLQKDAYSFLNWDIIPGILARCFGMSTTCLKYLAGTLPIPDGEDCVYDLTKTDAVVININFSQTYEQAPYAVAHALAICSGLVVPLTEHNRIHSQLADGAPAVVGLKPLTMFSGHVVLAYAFLAVGTTSYIYVYDSNLFSDPGGRYLKYEDTGTRFAGVKDQLYSEPDREVVEKATSTTSGDNYESLVSAKYYAFPAETFDVVGDLASLAICAARAEGAAGGHVVVYLGSPAHALFVDAAGRRTGYAGGGFINEIPEAALFVDEGFEWYELPTGESYAVTVVGTAGGIVHLGQVVPTGELLGGATYDGIPVVQGTRLTFTTGTGFLAPPVGVDLDGDGTIEYVVLPAQTFQYGENYEVGDVSGDGVIDAVDVRMCLQTATSFLAGTAAQRAAADVDHDGDVDLDDAQILAEYVLGLRTSLPGGGS